MKPFRQRPPAVTVCTCNLRNETPQRLAEGRVKSRRPMQTNPNGFNQGPREEDDLVHNPYPTSTHERASLHVLDTNHQSAPLRRGPRPRALCDQGHGVEPYVLTLANRADLPPARRLSSSVLGCSLVRCSSAGVVRNLARSCGEDCSQGCPALLSIYYGDQGWQHAHWAVVSLLERAQS